MSFSSTNSNGMVAKWISRGATITELHVPDSQGNLADVVLGFDDEAGYASGDNQHFGCATGRYANRIKAGKFTLDGVEYQLAINNGPNHLHGGPKRGIDKVEWEGEAFESTEGSGVKFRYISPDGEENFPGTLAIEITYTLTEENAIKIEYEATTDKATPVNLTNHSYFNLSGHGAGSIFDHQVQIEADQYTVSDAGLVPTGELADVAGTPLDFRERHAIGERINELIETPPCGYDHNFVLRGENGVLRRIAEVYDPKSGRVMTVHTDQPGVQLYTGNHLHGRACKQGKIYPGYSALCLETQHFPDSPNQPSFPSTILRPGETYRHTCIYAFSNE